MGVYRQRDSKVWWMSFTAKGQRIRRSTGTTDKKVAQTILGKIKVLLVEDKWFEVDHLKRYTLADLIEKYAAQFTEKKGYYQKKRDKSIFKHLRRFFGEGATLQDVSDRVGEYEVFRGEESTARGGPPASSTILKELRLLGRMFNVARRRWQWRVNNPVRDIELPAANDERVRHLTADEFRKVFHCLTKAPQWLRPLVLIAVVTGIRLGNLLALKWAKVDLTNASVILDAKETKNKDFFGSPLAVIAAEVLGNLAEARIEGCALVFNDGGQPLYEVKVRRAFRAVLEDAGVEDFRFHDLRHTFASYLRQNGAELHEIAALLGLKDLRMVFRYAHINTESLRKPVSVIDGVVRQMLSEI